MIKQMTAYFEENNLWLNPMFAGLIILIVPTLVSIIQPALLAQIPKWIQPVGIALSGLGTGIGAYLTDTPSARIFRFLGSASAVGALLTLIF